MNKEELCKVFCDELVMRQVPVGWAVGTGFASESGDQIGFYIVGPDEKGHYKIQDDGLTIWNLESAGADLEIATRAEVFYSLLKQYGFIYDQKESILSSDGLEEQQIPHHALRFVALLLRLQDMIFLVHERAARAF